MKSRDESLHELEFLDDQPDKDGDIYIRSLRTFHAALSDLADSAIAGKIDLQEALSVLEKAAGKSTEYNYYTM